jgi:transposase
LRYLDDCDLAINNNIAERERKQVVIGRKNRLFADTQDGAYTNAVMYSLVQTTNTNGLGPYSYLMHVFEKSPNTTTTEELERLSPWNIRFAEDDCSARPPQTKINERNAYQKNHYI